MSNMSFAIDAIPTPRLNLAGAFREDLEYYISNKRMPPLGRSALSRAEEQLNNYLKYVNESFIQEGFSATNEGVSTSLDTPIVQWSIDGSATITDATATTVTLNIAPTDTADLLANWVICGTHEPQVDEEENEDGSTTTTETLGVLTVEMWLDTTKQREWRQTLVKGENLISAGICYGGRSKGTHLVQLKLRCSNGTLHIAANDHYAWGYGRIVR